MFPPPEATGSRSGTCSSTRAACPRTRTDCSTATPPRDRFRTWAPAELIRRAVKDGNRDRPLLFPPGTDHHYSGTDFIVLEMIIEKVAGRSFRTETDQRIIRPLGLRDTRLPGSLPFIGPTPTATNR
ncbi:serine hydrolase domain-containing protein [Streptomyces sp. NPDC007162]|uniref:serine hydrolase domain-containing protein n=1 Tax=Streptomyces sp. NPDC007162 TaxID=3156917 RepID=UPI0033ED5C6E